MFKKHGVTALDDIIAQLKAGGMIHLARTLNWLSVPYLR